MSTVDVISVTNSREKCRPGRLWRWGHGQIKAPPGPGRGILSPFETLMTSRLVPLVVVFWLGCPSSGRAAPPIDTAAERQKLEHLDVRLAIMKREAQKIREGHFLKAVQEDAVHLRDIAEKPLEDFDAVDALVVGAQSGLEAIKLKSGLQETRGLRTLLDRGASNAERAIGGAYAGVAAVELANELHGLAQDLEAERRNASRTPALDPWIHRLEQVKMGLQTNDALHFVDPLSQKGSEGMLGLSLSVLHACRAGQNLDDPTEREKSLDRAYKEFREGSTALLSTGGPAGSAAAARAGMLAIGADAWWRVGYYFTALKFSRGLKYEAEEIQARMNNLALHQILVADWERDQVLGRLARAERQHPGEPGGIKLSGVIADDLSARLEIEAVHFDPRAGSITLAGRHSRHSFGIGLLRDALRLAREVHEPFFSLEPVNVADWDRQLIVAQDLLRARYTGSRNGRRKIARRLQELGTPVPGGEILAATLEELDPGIWEEVNRDLDPRVELVFSPAWAGSTRLGWILYEADLAIKAVCAGFTESETTVQLADVWSIPGFEPEWVHTHGHAGRANFELEPGTAARRGETLDLSEIRPRLVIVHRAPGTSQDLPPCDLCQKISGHFAVHWREYADRVRPIGELMTVLRAYVAARFLLQHHAGLVAFVDSLQHSEPDSRTPLYRIGPIVFRARVVDGDLEPLAPDRPALFDLGGGFGGGIAFKAGGVSFEPALPADPSWAGEMLGARVDSPGVRVTSHGLALDLELVGPRLPAEIQWQMYVLVLAVGLLAGSFRVRPLRAVESLTSVTCPHCRRLHRFLETVGGAADLVAASTIVFLALLPGAAAWILERKGEAGASGYVTVVLALVLGSVWITGSLAARLSRAAGLGEAYGPSRMLALMSTALFLAGGSWIVRGWVIGVDPLERATALLGAELVETLLLVIGNSPVAAQAMVVLGGSILISFLFRWILPFLGSSRPLLWRRRACGSGG